MPHAWNLWEWLDAIRADTDQQPDIVQAVQPTIALGDQRTLAPHLTGPRGLTGGKRASVAGVASYFQLASLAPGGIVITTLGIGSTATDTFLMRVVSTATTLGNVVTSEVMSIGHGTPLSTAQLGTAAVWASPTSYPTMRLSAGGSFGDPLDIYVPCGSFLEVCTGGVATQLNAFCIFDEYHAVRGAS